MFRPLPQFAVRALALYMATTGFVDLHACAASSSGGLPDGVSASHGRQVVSVSPAGQAWNESRGHPATASLFGRGSADETAKVWVMFADKGFESARAYDAAIAEVERTSNPRTVARRQARRNRPGLFDWHDLPVNEAYIAGVTATGVEVHVTSRWLNAVSIRATAEQVAEISELPYVEIIQPVRRGVRRAPEDSENAAGKVATAASDHSVSSRSLDYGEATNQLAQINLIALHDLGYTGAGVVVGIIDSGCETTHAVFNDPVKPVTVLAEWDFVHDDGNVGIDPGDLPAEHSHGTKLLGILGGYRPGEYIGGAFDASFILCKTEDESDEYPGEEDNFVAALEFVETNGADMFTSSLGYLDWYTPEDYDGLTAVTTIGVNIASANGMHCCKSGGNAGHDADPTTWHLDVPGDAFKMIACGSVDGHGNIAGSSSDGPTADGRVKPEVLARGVATRTVDPFDDLGYTDSNGTSFAAPLVAGAMACLIQAHPTWTVDQLRAHLFHTADYYVANGTFEPTYVRGYGVINAVAAHAGDCNGNGIDDETDIAGSTSEDCNGNGVPDECDLGPAGDYDDCNGNGLVDACDISGGTSQDENANGVPDECEVVPPSAAPEPHNVQKNRYISFDPAGAEGVAYQVELTDSTHFPGSVGVLGWVGDPDANAVARLSSEPVIRDWLEPVIHVGACEIVPAATYAVRAMAYEVILSEPLMIDTVPEPSPKLWADTVGPMDAGTWGPPNGLVTMEDIMAAIQRFQYAPTAPHFTWVDLDGEIPNTIVNMTDISRIVQGFKGEPYPFSDPAMCP